MFCTKCGKKLYDGDSFCAYCGAKVREELMFKTETKAPTRTTRYDEVVFNPPFKAEAERRTQHISEEANLYRSGNYSSVTVQTEKGEFSITISRKKEEENQNGN